MNSPSSNPVLRRRVFYIPGYDPFPPRRYRELYRSEAARQAEVSGQIISVSGVAGAPANWKVRTEADGSETLTQFEVLKWSDLVRDSFSASVAGTYAALFQTAWVYISTGTLFRLMRLRKGPVTAALYPVVMLLVQALVALTAGYVLIRSGHTVLADVMHTGLRTGLLWIAAAILVVLLLMVLRACDNRLFAYYLMHDFAYAASCQGAYPRALSDRLDVFTDQIRSALKEDTGEILVVGHSSGAFLAISVLARLLRQVDAEELQQAPALSLLTLGQVVPMVSFLPAAEVLRADLLLMGEQEYVFWVDVSAPGDGCSFALCHPVAVSGQSTPATRHPLVLSAAFTQTLSEQKWKSLRWRFFRLHFQYLCAFDRPADYDYFDITAGPQTLSGRYAGRPPSPSVISRPQSGHTSVSG